MLRLSLCLAVFLAAALTFLLEPMVGRMMLPDYGGTALVWSTLLLFFQGLLFLAYAAVHLAVRRLPWAWVAGGHLALCLVAILGLPVALGEPATGGGGEACEILARSLAGVGLPFVLLTAVCPLAMAGAGPLALGRQRDAFFLVAASNAGSLTGLLAYPVGFSSLGGLAAQGRLWAAGFIGLTALLAPAWTGLGCGRKVALARVAAAAPQAGPPPLVPLPPGSRARWLALATLASAWLSSATAAITLDSSSGPLGWTLPLAVYLATLMVAFARPSPALLPAARRALVATLPVAAVLAGQGSVAVWAGAGHLVALAAGTWACHLALAVARPPPARATDFLFFTAAGGVLGALTCALVAPALFSRVAEYPLVLATAGLWHLGAFRRARGVGGDLAVAAAALALGLTAGAVGKPTVVGIAPALAWQLWRGRGVPRALLVGALAVCGLRLTGFDDEAVEHRARSFYSAVTLGRLAAAPHLRYEKSGTTLHGVQDTRPAHAREALGYYHADGPVGEVFTHLVRPDGRPVGVVGLGIGSLACAAGLGQTTTFFELDPMVAGIARDKKWFTHLAACPAEVVVGDARRQLAGWPRASLGTLVLDAYSSDAVPTHLLTEEAMAIFWRALADDGIWVGHLSHRSLDLLQPVACWAGKHGLHLARRLDPSGSAASGSSKWASLWAVVARDPARLAPLRERAGWDVSPMVCRIRPWTDDDVSLLSIWRRGPDRYAAAAR